MADTDDSGQAIALIAKAVALSSKIAATSSFREKAWMLKELRNEYKELGAVISGVENAIGIDMQNKKEAVEGVGTLERHRDVSRRNWQHDDLLRVVLDSDRRSKDSDTGEIEGDLDVLRDVYGLRGYNARVTALRSRGIDPDEYAETEARGWKIRLT